MVRKKRIKKNRVIIRDGYYNALGAKSDENPFTQWFYYYQEELKDGLELTGTIMQLEKTNPKFRRLQPVTQGDSVPDGLCESRIAVVSIKVPPVASIDKRVPLVVQLDVEALGPPIYLLLQQPQFVVGTSECNPQRQANIGGFLFN